MDVEVVPDYTYLGFIKTTNLSIGPDIVRCMKAFNTQFYSFYRRFKFANLRSKIFLFRSLCMSLYGCKQWWNRSKVKVRLKSSAMAYHKALKLLLAIPKRSSSHLTCNWLNLLTYDHEINRKSIQFGFNVLNSKSPCMTRIHLEMQRGVLLRGIADIARNVYSILNVFDNDRDAIWARIWFVQRSERIYGIHY